MSDKLSDHGSVKLDDMDLAYTREGAGTPLLVVGSSIYYPRTFSTALRQSCLLICSDLPHFVLPRQDFNYERISFDFYADCIEAIRQDAGLKKIVVVGHSHHGNVALEYAKRFPNSVSHVVLIGSPPVDVASTLAGARRYWEMNASQQRKELLERRRSSIDQQWFASLAPADAYIAQYVADAPLYWCDPLYDASWLWQGMCFDMGAIHAFRDLFQSYRLHWDARSVAAPVLVLMGKQDYAVPPTLWDDSLSTFENLTFRVLENSGHTPQLEQPEVFDQLLLAWLQEQPVT